ncbi:MAG TPA: hypothetical protein VFD39_08370, partial [Trueperaceae bacterium]|nr:hypothetical protein [Trueperaceae bacterium]
MSAAVPKQGEPTGRQDGNDGHVDDLPAARILVLSGRTRADARSYLTNRLLITPNDRAASAVRGAAAGGKSLAGWAEELLHGAGWSPASVVAQLDGLRRAHGPDLAGGAAEATVNTLGAAVRELLRAGLGQADEVVERLLAADDLAARTKALARVTLRYRELLSVDRLVDPAEALWLAAQLGTAPVPVLVAGYPRVGVAELAFLDALAAAGSVFVLPAGFVASEDAAAALSARGWVIEDRMTEDRAT